MRIKQFEREKNTNIETDPRSLVKEKHCNQIYQTNFTGLTENLTINKHMYNKICEAFPLILQRNIYIR